MACDVCFYLGSTKMIGGKRLCDDCAEDMEIDKDPPVAVTNEFGQWILVKDGPHDR